MNPFESLYKALSSDDEITQRVKAIRPIVLQPDDEFPAIIIKSISNVPTTSLKGDTGRLDTDRYQVDVWSESLLGAEEIAALVRGAVNHSDLMTARYDGRETAYNDKTNRYTVQTEFVIMTKT